MTQYAFGVQGGDAGKRACASLTSAVTKALCKDQKRRCKEIVLTTLVRGHAIDPMQKACYQSIAMTRNVLLRQEESRDLWRKAWARNRETRTTHNTPGLVANITRHEMLAKDGGGMGVDYETTEKSHPLDDRKFKHVLCVPSMREGTRDPGPHVEMPR